MKNNHMWLRLFLGMFSVANILVGLIAFFARSEMVKVVALLYGGSVEMNPQIAHVITMLGAYALAVGIMAWFAVADPVKNIRIIDGILVLLFLRVLQRLFFAGQISQAFGISAGRNWANIAFFLTIALVILALRPQGKKA